MRKTRSLRQSALVILLGSLLIVCGSLAVAQQGRSARPSDKTVAQKNRAESPAKRGEESPKSPKARSQSSEERPPRKAETESSSSSRNAPAGDVAVTPGREAAALTFARLHHPELAELLEQLARINRPEYQKAIRELFQTSEKLARLAEQRSTERYELALEAWKIDSRIRLLAARMTMSDDPALEAELKAALEERIQIRLAQLQFDRQRAAERLEQLDQSIEALEQDREAALLKELERVKRGLPTRPQRTKAAAAPKEAPAKTSDKPNNNAPKRSKPAEAERE